MKRILMTLALMPLMAFATTWYVDGTNGTDENPGTSPAEAKATIQAAIDVSADNDTILVAPGTYAPIASDNRLLTIRSEEGAYVTIIDGGGVQRCANLREVDNVNLDEDNIPVATNTVLDGFTLRNGGNAAHGGGARGGIIRRCIMTGNNVNQGGGAYASITEDCLIYGNTAAGNGGGVNCGIAKNCTIYNNYAAHNGGGSANCALYNCIVFENSSGWDWGGDGGQIYNWATARLVSGIGITSCEKYCVNTNDPHFVDAANGDYRLAADSPCIDAGDNSYVVGDTDLDGSGRIVNGKVDIGCYEYGSVGGPYVEKVGETNWTYMIKNGKASVGDGANAAVDKAIAGAVDVPTRLRTRPVVAIDDNALQGCTNMTSVTIPACVTTIGERAFEGCGKLADVYYEGETVSSIGADAFRGCYWDLIMHVPTTWQGRGRTICGYTVWKGDDPNEVVRVVSTNMVVHYMTTNTPVEVVAPISADTGIVNVMTEVKGGNVAIPDSWAKGFATFEAKFGSNFTDALTRQTGKYDCNNTPMLVWQDYVAGTDPTNPDDTFTATITMVEGVPQVAWKPVLTEEAAAKRVYRKFGKVKLTDEWAEIPTGHEADYNFFKVTVEMK